MTLIIDPAIRVVCAHSILRSVRLHHSLAITEGASL